VRRRRTVLLQLAAGLLATRCLHAQPSGAVLRIGFVSPLTGPSPEGRRTVEPLYAGLRDLGWSEGKNFATEIRYAGPNNPQRQRELAAELKALPVAVIVAWGTIAIRTALDGAPGVPIVMIAAADPVGSGFAATLARPGGDLTGTSANGEEVLAKQVELLSAAVPQVRKITMVSNAANPANRQFFNAMASRASQLGLQLDRKDVASVAEIDAAISGARGGALVVVNGPLMNENHVHIVGQTLRAQVPAVFGGREYVVAGGLMSLLSPNDWHMRTAATYIHKIFKGAKPADLPIERPTKFDLVINLKTAKALGITIPQSLLLRADELIQ
jgi:putative ABC transport system substrate-binding protein